MPSNLPSSEQQRRLSAVPLWLLNVLGAVVYGLGVSPVFTRFYELHFGLGDWKAGALALGAGLIGAVCLVPGLLLGQRQTKFLGTAVVLLCMWGGAWLRWQRDAPLAEIFDAPYFSYVFGVAAALLLTTEIAQSVWLRISASRAANDRDDDAEDRIRSVAEGVALLLAAVVGVINTPIGIRLDDPAWEGLPNLPCWVWAC